MKTLSEMMEEVAKGGPMRRLEFIPVIHKEQGLEWLCQIYLGPGNSLISNWEKTPEAALKAAMKEIGK